MAIFSKTETKPLKLRIQKALAEGRTQQALELAKQLAKQEPTDEHRQLLRTATFERGCHLLKDGKQREAIVVFQNALAMNGPPEFRVAVAAKLAQAGDVTSALAMFAQLPDSPERAKAFEQAVDAALMKGAAGRALLPADLHPSFDAILVAFDRLEKSQDDEARDALQPIGLSSPFLEWKLMLRGLGAFYLKDDARALDNWQRLNPERQPWRLVAPFRFQIDPAFRDAQPVATRHRLQGLLDRTSHVGLIGTLRDLEKTLAQPWNEKKQVNEAFRKCTSIQAVLAATDPALARRIAEALYVKIYCDGVPPDAARFNESFSGSLDDPHGYRLFAIVCEREQELDFAIESWLNYERDIAEMSDRFPEPAGKLARALVWEHLGQVVDDALPKYPEMPKRIPRPDECYRKSIALAPGRVRPHQLLLDELRANPKKQAQAVAAAKKLVAEFPDHAATWEFLGDESLDTKKPEAAVDAYRAALKGDPMRRDLRRKLADAVWAQGVKLATPGPRVKSAPNPEAYRPVLEEAIRFTEGSLIARYAAWAVLESRLGHADAARDLLAKAENQPTGRLAVPLALHVAAQIDKKLAPEIRDEYAARWQQALEQKPTSDEILVTLETLAHFDSKALRGKKALVESFLPKLTNALLEAFNEDQLLKLARRLGDVKMTPAAKKVITHAKRRFPKNPHVLLLLCDLLTSGSGGRALNWQINDALQRARKIAIGLPREQQEAVIKEIERHETKLRDFDEGFGPSLMNAFGKMMESFLDQEGFEDEDDGW